MFKLKNRMRKLNRYLEKNSGIVILSLAGMVAIYNSIYNTNKDWLTLCIAMMTVYIAYQQYITNKNKLKLDLFERRYKVYQAVVELLGIIVREADISDEGLRNFSIKTNDALFLFHQEVEDYLKVLHKNAVELQYNVKMYNLVVEGKQSMTQEEHERNVNRNYDLIMWFSNQFNEVRELFYPYLSINNVR